MSESPKDAVETLVFKNNSLIDATFTSRKQRRIVWATLTSGTSTTLYSVSPHGKLEAAASIHWHRAGSHLSLRNSAQSTVELEGNEFTIEQFGWRVRRGAFLSGIKSNYFTLGSHRCRWKPDSSGRLFDQTQYMSDAMTWVCEAEDVVGPPPHDSHGLSKLNSVLKKQSISKSTLATFCPSYNFSRHGGDLAIYPEGEPWTVWLLLSLILMHVKRQEWEKVQSQASPEALEATLGQRAAPTRPVP
ncbi:SubName: Full=Uncharacterized protein {ECO:0000313/EMBL:CCA68262.1} [Serendipita indica DSM 11827]|uniref:Uncharacterized protein n=1 Tax=Serendipita indica (strain DSM 11827) TaxID=1109443 RepID=G4TAB9_SERID|nr:SubName: Full=Uncharacterized protein {ECO:0000313/EMBL:CCA68262.1} [Serendipita indica DSM 11827]CCA68262.1 hypothetical protein PIIN_02127 [Serendipita indica DSM 11827]